MKLICESIEQILLTPLSERGLLPRFDYGCHDSLLASNGIRTISLMGHFAREVRIYSDQRINLAEA